MYISKVEFNDLNSIYELGKNNIHIYYEKNHLASFFKSNNYRLFKISYNNKIFGFIIYQIKSSSKIHIMSFAIDSQIRNKGLGTSLLNFVKSNYPKSLITLNVQTSNINALNFYYKNNFKADIFKHNYYNEDIRDAIQMIYNPNKNIC